MPNTKKWRKWERLAYSTSLPERKVLNDCEKREELGIQTRGVKIPTSCGCVPGFETELKLRPVYLVHNQQLELSINGLKNSLYTLLNVHCLGINFPSPKLRDAQTSLTSTIEKFKFT